ncbi:pyridoxine/pyridoxamine 5'-phosphate oxidase-like isoform X1 [Babylonia areolata]|uniref:pyridoxine/pyridoxamine 5'-phosphate oxidase-like isoform X1 n=1 Tax=Babylonia areolata TaxID=304850 RepID=UPI003FD65C46
MLEYADESIPVPRPHWGGYHMIPDSFEFWYKHRNRFHDRLRFQRPKAGEVINSDLTMKAEDGWLLETLAHWVV